MNSSKVRAGGALALGVLFIPFALFARANDGFTEGGAIPCIWRSLTGYPCPGCGLTRAFASLTQFELLESIQFNPEALIFTTVAILAVLTPRSVISLRHFLGEKIRVSSDKKVLATAMIFFAALWVLNIIRVSTGFYPTT